MTGVTACLHCPLGIDHLVQKGCVPLLNWEPVSGFEPLACRLQEVRFVAICALTALIPHVIALMALAELGFSGGSSHDSSHAAKQ